MWESRSEKLTKIFTEPDVLLLKNKMVSASGGQTM